MNDLQKWLYDHDVSSPHEIPEDLKPEFDSRFKDDVIFHPQPGGQTDFQECPADIVIYGGEAGGGKSWSLLYEHLKWIHIPKYAGTMIRKLYPQIFGVGGLWEEAKRLYPHLGGVPVASETPHFRFPSGAKVFFKNSQYAATVALAWQGLASPLMGIDEVTQFSKEEFTYIMGRNRCSATGIQSYMRCTCNPDPLSFVRKMIDWWVGEDGLIIPERCGVIKYFLHRNDEFVWADTKEELEDRFGKDSEPKSFTFLRGKLDDNKKLTETDKGYKASLQNLSEAQKHSLCGGNWNEIENPDALFSHNNINANRKEYISLDFFTRVVVAIDPAGSTNVKSDETGIVAAGLGKDGRGYLLKDVTGKYKPTQWAKAACGLYDLYLADKIVAEKNYGGDMVQSTIEAHNDKIIPKLVTASKGKTLRAEPVSDLYSRGQISHVGHELTDLENEICNWNPHDPENKNRKSPNRMDAMVFAFTELMLEKPKRMPRIH